MNQFQKYLKSYFDVEKENLEKISSYFDLIQFKKNDYYLKENQYSTQLGFVQSGILREFTVDESGKEITKWISTKGYFVVDLVSFYFQKPARWNIQALADCEIFVINQENFHKISEDIPNWETLEKLFIAKCFGHLEDRIVNQISLNAEQRYDQLFTFNKELFNQVPLQYLASMIGMTPETFSRIRNQKAKDFP